jgi:dyslexia susceptibility 1 candidate gene 1 protein
MPIVAEYSWSEKKDQVNVSLPLKGVSASKVDILVSAHALKVNFSPYILDILLFDAVDSIRHKATVKDGTLHITLCKRQPGFWGQFESDEKDIETIYAKKGESWKEREELDTKLAMQHKDRKIEEERHAVRQQMALEDAERTRLEQTKQQEKESAEKEVYEVLSKLQQHSSAQTNSKQASKSTPVAATTTKKLVSFLPEENETPVESRERAIFEDDDEYDMMDDVLSNDGDISAATKTISKSKSANGDPEDIGGESDEEIQKNSKEDDIRYVPPPRNSQLHNMAEHDTVNEGSEHNSIHNGKVSIQFTPRVFPTPMRESKAAEEEDWIAKNRRHLKKHGVLGKHLQSNTRNPRVANGSNTSDISEEDATWLKAKGDDFYRIGDVRSALNAYSAALDSDEDFIACYANRAVCYLQLQMYDQCVVDCTEAVDRVTREMHKMQEQHAAVVGKDDAPHDPLRHQAMAQTDKSLHEINQLRAWLVKLLVRRGGAYCHLGRFRESVADYTQTQVLLTQNPALLSSSALSSSTGKASGGSSSGGGSGGVSLESVEADIQRLKQLVQIENWKKAADEAYAEGRITDALAAYDRLLEVFPVHVSALANRAACHMVAGAHAQCIQDCDTALQVLQELGGTTNTGSAASSSASAQVRHQTMLSFLLPAKTSDKRKQWILRLWSRKAVAYLAQEKLQEAWQCYETASTIDPENVALQRDRDALEELMQKQQQEQQQLEDSNQTQNRNNTIPTNE